MAIDSNCTSPSHSTERAGTRPPGVEADARPEERCSRPGTWTDPVQEAEWGLLDFVTIEDSLAVQSTKRGAAWMSGPTRYAAASMRS